VNISNNVVTGNLTPFACMGGVVASDGSNLRLSNSGGAVPACVPNGTINKN